MSKDETGLPPELVATLFMVSATAIRSVKTVGGVKSGDTVLVHAGAGGAWTTLPTLLDGSRHSIIMLPEAIK